MLFRSKLARWFAVATTVTAGVMLVPSPAHAGTASSVAAICWRPPGTDLLEWGVQGLFYGSGNHGSAQHTVNANLYFDGDWRDSVTFRHPHSPVVNTKRWRSGVIGGKRWRIDAMAFTHGADVKTTTCYVT